MTRVGDYDLDRQIGAGATGTVWTAHQRGPVSRVVALKRLRAGGGDADLARIRREALVLTELDHPHVVRVLGVVEDGDGLALVMQYAPGGSLRDMLAERGRLTPGEVVAVAAPLAEALASAHRRGVLHGDVTPANVLFTSDGEPLLTDFGVARSLGQHTSDLVAGTAGYVDPELLDGARPDPRADIYSLGVVCYHALTGAPPYDGPGILAVARAADAGDHAPLGEAPGVPAALARVVEQAMDRRPERRFASAGDLARALRTTVPAGEARLPGPAVAPGAGISGDGGRDGDGSGLTHTFGPRPPRREAAPPRDRSWRLPVVLAGAGLALVAILAVVRATLGDDGTGEDARGDDAGDCPAVPVPVPVPGGQAVTGDVSGDGCTVTGTYQSERLPGGGTAMVLTIRLDGADQRIGLGQAGDQVVLGDWDCDGVDTPALYRAGDGAVEYYDVWPTVEEQAYQPASTDQAAAGGEASLRAGSGGDGDGDDGDGDDDGGEGDDGACDSVEVVPRSAAPAASAIM
jgi:tRNA A-37 threonylcarbamoyl transferase component Bud32